MEIKKNLKLVSSYEELAKKVGALKTLGKTVIYLSGTFDLLHIGHCRYFRTAIEEAMRVTEQPEKEIILIVGVDNDEEVRKRKGEFRPIVPQDERAEMLEYIDDVDYVAIKEEEELGWRLGEMIRPDFLILSESTTFLNTSSKEDMIGNIKQWAGDVIILPPQAMTSTTGKIHKLHTETIVGIRNKFEPILREQFESIVNSFGDLADELLGDRKPNKPREKGV